MRLNSAEPWYKQGWPWFLIAVPATAVVGSLVTLWLAVSSWDGLVVDDYYQEGKTIERTLGRALRAKEIGHVADVRIRSDAILVELSAATDVQFPPRLVVTIAHPTRAGHDQHLLLTGTGRAFRAELEPLTAGRWLIQLEDESHTWRLAGTMQVPADGNIRILPNDL
jgi:hypothetical protein